MPKRITLSDKEYFKLLELKAKYKTNSLFAILSLVPDNQNGNMVLKDDGQITNMVKCPDAIKPKREFSHNGATDILPLCQCGHPELHHGADGCLGEGGLCECNKNYYPQPLD